MGDLLRWVSGAGFRGRFRADRGYRDPQRGRARGLPRLPRTLPSGASVDAIAASPFPETPKREPMKTTFDLGSGASALR